MAGSVGANDYSPLLERRFEVVDGRGQLSFQLVAEAARFADGLAEFGMGRIDVTEHLLFKSAQPLQGYVFHQPGVDRVENDHLVAQIERLVLAPV